MNARGGAALVQCSWLSWMQYRSFFFLLAFGWMIPPLVSLFAWMAAAGNGQVAGMGRAEFAAYYLVLVLVNQITYSQTNWTVGDVIREGGLDFWLLRPMAALYNPLSSEAAGKTVYLAFVIPLALGLALLLKPELHTSPSQVILALAALILAWALRFFWGLWLALLAFWATRADALLALQDGMIFLLSGVVAPVALLPQGLQTAAKLLPFRYMVGFPVEILMQPLTARELLAGFACQAGWLLLSLLLCAGLWRAGLRRYASAKG